MNRRRRFADAIALALVVLFGAGVVFADEVTGALYRYMSTGQTRAAFIPPLRFDLGSSTKSSTATSTFTRTGTLRNVITQLTYTGTVTDTQQSVSMSITDFDVSSLIPYSEVTATSTSTVGDVTTGHHGFVPKANSSTSQFLRGDGSWATPTLDVPTSDVCQYYYAVGASLLGLTGPGKNLCDKFIYTATPTAPLGTVSSSGSGSAVALAAQGKITLTSGTASGAFVQLNQSYSNKLFAGRPDNVKWYMVAEMAMTSSISSTTQLLHCLVDTSSSYSACVGVRGATSTTQYIGLAGTNTWSSGISIDANPHVFEFWQPTTDTALVTYRIDGTTTGTATIDNASSWTATHARLVAATGTVTGTTRTMDVYHYNIVVPNR